MGRRDQGTAGFELRGQVMGSWACARANARRTLALFVGLTCGMAQLARAAPPALDGDAPEADVSQPPDSQPDPQPDPQTAGGWYARGYELGNAGNFDAAAEAFLRSYQLQPTSEALFNAALAFENAGATLTAIATYERFLAEPARKEDLVDAAQRSIDAMTREVAMIKGVRISATRPPTQLLVQGQPIELDDFPLLVLPGVIQIEIVDEHGERAHETYELAAGEALVADLRALLRAPASEPKPVVDPGPTKTELEAARAHTKLALALRTTTWVGLGSSSAAAVSLLTLGLLANRERQRFEAASCYMFVDNVCPPDFEIGDPELHKDAYDRYVLGTKVMAGVTAGLALTTLVIGLVSVRQARKGRKGRQVHVEDRPVVQIRPEPGGVALQF